MTSASVRKPRTVEKTIGFRRWRLVRKIETVLVPKVGHMLTAEAPERVNEKVSEFLSTTN